MNKFITRLSIFLLCLIMFFLSNGLINYLLYSNYSCGIKESNVVITGDSHLKNGLNPKLLNNAINISQSAETLPLTYWKIKKILQTYTPDIIIIGFGPHIITTFQDLKFSHEPWASEMIGRSYPIQDFNSFNKIEIDFTKYIKILWKKTGFYPTLNHCNYLGSYSNVIKNDLSHIDARIKQHFYFKGNKVEVSNTATYYLNKLLDLCRSRDLKLVIASTPVHPKYYSGIPINIIKKYNSLIKSMRSNGIKVIDKTHKFYPDSLYMNADHLNQYGANRFTAEVKRILVKI